MSGSVAHSPRNMHILARGCADEEEDRPVEEGEEEAVCRVDNVKEVSDIDEICLRKVSLQGAATGAARAVDGVCTIILAADVSFLEAVPVGHDLG